MFSTILYENVVLLTPNRGLELHSGLPGPSWGPLGAPLGCLGCSLGVFLGSLGCLGGPLGVLLGSLGLVLKLSWRFLGLREGPKKPQESQKRASRGPFLGTLILRRNCSESLHELSTKLLFSFSGIRATSKKSISNSYVCPVGLGSRSATGPTNRVVSELLYLKN